MITIVKKRIYVLGHWPIVYKCSKNQSLFLMLSWNALHTLFHDKKGRTIYICFPYKWKRQFLRRENKDTDAQSSRSEVVDSVVFILCVWNIYSWRGRGKDSLYCSLQLFYLLKHGCTWLTFLGSFLNTDLFQNTLRSVLIYNMKILEHMPILASMFSSKFASKWEGKKRQYDLEQDREKIFLGWTWKGAWDRTASFNGKLLIRPKVGYLPTGSCRREAPANLIF